MLKVRVVLVNGELWSAVSVIEYRVGDVTIEVCDVNDVAPRFINNGFTAGNTKCFAQIYMYQVGMCAHTHAHTHTCTHTHTHTHTHVYTQPKAHGPWALGVHILGK